MTSEGTTGPATHLHPRPPRSGLTDAELEAIVKLIGRARHVVIGTAADPVSRADGARIASAWGGLVLATVTWPEQAASWLRQARRFATPDPDVWVVSATPAGWAGLTRRLLASTSWSPHRTVVTSALDGYPLAGLRGTRADGTTWENR
jgi:CelD/BcsL family acetyltransferase involved in cellulose biosynthesis